MTRIVNAIYERGVFRILNAPDLPLKDGEQVQLTVDVSTSAGDDPLSMAAQVYEGMSDEEIDEVEGIALNRENFFNRSI